MNTKKIVGKSFTAAVLALVMMFALAVGCLAAPAANVSTSSDGKVKIDYSKAASGVVTVTTDISGNPKLCVIVTAPSGLQYKYFNTSSAGKAEDFVLSEGDGTYKVAVYKNVSGNSYTTLHATSFDVKLNSTTTPFTRSNFYVEYDADTKCVAAVPTICKNAKTDLDKVQAIYYYVIGNFSYDYDKAATVESGYRPKLDTVWNDKKGICFDYAAVMAAMLRSQGIPTKMAVGYAGTAYHAWISVYTAETGWIEAIIHFDGTDWTLMDPTFASTGKENKEVLDFISNPANYTAKYVY